MGKAILIGLAVASLAIASACAPTRQATYRDLERLGREYRGGVEAPRNAHEATVADACGASRFRALLGARASEIDPATLPSSARIVGPRTVVTDDFVPERLNILVDADGRVTSMRCY